MGQQLSSPLSFLQHKQGESKPLPALLAPESCLLPLPGSGRGAEAAWEV